MFAYITGTLLGVSLIPIPFEMLPANSPLLSSDIRLAVARSLGKILFDGDLGMSRDRI